ncbi:MAG: hypothetical protein ABJH20_01555 [Rhizobiaceae bacterium]
MLEIQHGVFLKLHTELLVKDVGLAAATGVTGRSKATIGRYYSTDLEHAKRFMPIDAVAALEELSGRAHISTALSSLKDEVPHKCNMLERASFSDVPTVLAKLSEQFAALAGDMLRGSVDPKIPRTKKKQLDKIAAMQRTLTELKSILAR